MKEGLKVAIVGATGAVGKQLLSILEERSFPIQELSLFASPRSLGREISWKSKAYSCRVLEKGCFEGIDIAFFDASDAVSKEWVPQAADAGAWVIDNSATFRQDPDVLLAVPEVNGKELASRLKAKLGKSIPSRERIISGPNCSTVQMVVALKPIHDLVGLKRVVVSTYQSVSGAGSEAMNELSSQTVRFLEQKPYSMTVFPHRIAFNCIPQVGSFKENGYTGEETKIVQETRKIMGIPQLRISVTAVRVPTFSCHGESVNIECEKPFHLDQIYKALQSQPGIIVRDDIQNLIYPTGVESSNQDGVYVGRIRKDESVEFGLNLWIVSDNLRKGAALNAVQVGEILLKTFC